MTQVSTPLATISLRTYAAADSKCLMYLHSTHNKFVLIIGMLIFNKFSFEFFNTIGKIKLLSNLKARL